MSYELVTSLPGYRTELVGRYQATVVASTLLHAEWGDWTRYLFYVCGASGKSIAH